MSGEKGERTSHSSSVLHLNLLSLQSILLMLHRCCKKMIRVPCNYTAFFLWSRNDEEGLRVKLWVQVSILPNTPAYRVAIPERSTRDKSPHVLPSPHPEQASTIKASIPNLQALLLAEMQPLCLFVKHKIYISGFWANWDFSVLQVNKMDVYVDCEQFIFSLIRNCSYATEDITRHQSAATARQVRKVYMKI